jgi:hypothetical protein
LDALNLIEKAIGAGSLAFVAWIANRWIQAVEARFESNFTTIENRIASTEEKINALQNKYQDVLDIVLTKFTNWEDRISGLLAKAQTLDKDQMLIEIQNFKIQNRNDLEVMKLEISRVKNLVRTAGFESEFIQKIREIEAQLSARIKGNEERLNLCVKMISHLNEKSKTHDFQLQNLIAINKAKGNPKV